MRWAAVSATVALLAFLLLFPPRIGLANNNDFGKVTGPFALHAPAEDQFAYANLKWSFDRKYYAKSYFYSDEILVATIAIGLNRLTGAATFDIRWMGLLHSLLFLLAVYLLQPLLDDFSPAWRILISAIAIFVFADFLYAGLFNTFYMDAATYVSLMMSVVLFLRAAKWRRRADAIAMLAAILFMVLSKPQHAISGVWIAILFAAAGAKLWPGKGRAFGVVCAALVTAAVVIALTKEAPRAYEANGYYSAIFVQVLPNSSNVDGDLRALGLDSSYRTWIGTHAFSAGSGMDDPAFVRKFMERTSYARLACFYVTHPRDTWRALMRAGDLAGRVRPGLGNFDRSSGFAPFSESHAFTVWSDAKSALLHQHGGRFIAWNIVITALLCGAAILRRGALPPVAVPAAFALGAMTVTEWLEASLADAVEIARHHVIASALVDLELVFAIAIAIYPVARRKERIPIDPRS